MDEGEVELVLVNRADLIPSPDEVVDVRTAKMAIVKEAGTIIPMANVTEGGYSISFNVEAFKLWYRATCAELGVADELSSPKVRNRSNSW